ncbi:hypothetical protein COS78_00400 [Candidatus Shapirobacteria bacterium CG06_land_8_20_14_3_00_40_12]|uniref:Bro-N domain-containing protein n=1 Tax=Candidatus Shapirobacteria bacterium CG06_land_8_20_14_3_00_40_12 TaxID=1974881 RepID=A0A2M7AT56_9BACT|nr:MAG: hypothetical protein COS78_00400 [Candidatus Shapirobacteria bacterium CG06_land_8_20_14_3_00_40_12]
MKQIKTTSDVVVFDQRKIRKVWNEEKEIWYFSVIDVIEALTDSSIPRRYWSDLKSRLILEGSEVYEKIVQLELEATDGKMRETDVADTETIFRLIQSIPSPKAEPFKLWLARVGYERVEETIDPEKAIHRALNSYLKQGRTPEWVNLRLKSIEIRKDLTDEWQERGVNKGSEFAILTDDITYAWAGLSTKQYKKIKELKKENLRDNMTNLELVLNMLAEASTTEISKVKKPKNFPENRKVAQEGGGVAGVARKEIENKTGKSVISGQKYLR